MLAVISGLSMFLAIAGMGTAAYAGCIPIGGGKQYCASWIVGSTELAGFAKGLGNLDCTDKDSELECPGMSGEVFGTVPDPDGADCDPSTLDEDCLISVVAVCGPKKCEKNPSLPGCSDPTNVNSSHFSKSQIPVQKETFDDCRKNGNCKGLLTIVGEELAGEVCQGQGHVLINVLANPFNGSGCFCLGGFDGNGDCCTTGARDVNGFCEDGGVVPDENLECVDEFCEIDVATSQPGDLYNCGQPLGGPLL
jgi:hypothetical protein